MKKEKSINSIKKGKKAQTMSYRLKCKRTANGLSHYVPSDKKTLV